MPLQNVRPEIEQIEETINQQKAQGLSVIPKQENIFRALTVDPKDVRVVIMGQDPYPNAKHASGFSFSVPPETNPKPATLRNILQEHAADASTSSVQDGDLSAWAEQGILLLNRVLTVIEFESDSHRKLGWQKVTDRILEVTVQNNPDVLAILWGKQAQEVQKYFLPGNVLSSAHPSPLSSYRGFIGSKPFSRVNQILRDRGETPINW